MMVTPLFPSSLAAIDQTLARLTNVAHYFEDIRDQIEFLTFPPNVSSMDQLRELVRSNPKARSELQTAVEGVERAIGASLPLRFSVLTGTSLPERGIAVYLGTREETPPASPSLQLFTLSSSNEMTLAPRMPVRLMNKAHAPSIRGHFAYDDIVSLGALQFAGDRVTPLASPLRAEFSKRLTRIGRLTVLGLHEADLAFLEFRRNQVDVLLLGGVAAATPQFADAAIATLHPRLALLTSQEPENARMAGDTTVVPLHASNPATIEFHPIAQTIDLRQDGRSRSIPLKRQERILDILENLREGVSHDLTRRIAGTMTAQTAGQRAQGTWRWAKLIMNGAVSMALHYLLHLDFDPNRFVRAQEREEALMRVIDDMTGPLQIRDSVPDHVWAFKELLLRSGLLEPRD